MEHRLPSRMTREQRDHIFENDLLVAVRHLRLAMVRQGYAPDVDIVVKNADAAAHIAGLALQLRAHIGASEGYHPNVLARLAGLNFVRKA